MARYLTTIESALPQAEAFAYMADFANARLWDPSVSEARRVGEAPSRISGWCGPGMGMVMSVRLRGLLL